MKSGKKLDLSLYLVLDAINPVKQPNKAIRPIVVSAT